MSIWLKSNYGVVVPYYMTDLSNKQASNKKNHNKKKGGGGKQP